MSKAKDSSEVTTPLISSAVVQELASELIGSNQAPAIDEMVDEGNRVIQFTQRSAVVSCRRSPEDFDEEDTAKKAKTPKHVQGVYADVTIKVPRSDRDRSRTVRRARKRLRAARRMERCTEKQRVQQLKTVPKNRPKLLY